MKESLYKSDTFTIFRTHAILFSQPSELIAESGCLVQFFVSATGRDACRRPLSFLPQSVALAAGRPFCHLSFSLFFPHRHSQLVLKNAKALVWPVHRTLLAADLFM